MKDSMSSTVQGGGKPPAVLSIADEVIE